MLTAHRQLQVVGQWQLDWADVILKGDGACMLYRQGKGLHRTLSHTSFGTA
jgi:hypothetical protein